MIDIVIWTTLLLQHAQEALLSYVNGLIPAPPAQMVGACGQLRSYATQSSWVTALVPTWAISIAGGALVACIVASLAIRIARIVASFATLGGGS